MAILTASNMTSLNQFLTQICDSFEHFVSTHNSFFESNLFNAIFTVFFMYGVGRFYFNYFYLYRYKVIYKKEYDTKLNHIRYDSPKYISKGINTYFNRPSHFTKPFLIVMASLLCVMYVNGVSVVNNAHQVIISSTYYLYYLRDSFQGLYNAFFYTPYLLDTMGFWASKQFIYWFLFLVLASYIAFIACWVRYSLEISYFNFHKHLLSLSIGLTLFSIGTIFSYISTLDTVGYIYWGIILYLVVQPHVARLWGSLVPSLDAALFASHFFYNIKTYRQIGLFTFNVNQRDLGDNKILSTDAYQSVALAHNLVCLISFIYIGGCVSMWIGGALQGFTTEGSFWYGLFTSMNRSFWILQTSWDSLIHNFHISSLWSVALPAVLLLVACLPMFLITGAFFLSCVRYVLFNRPLY